MFGNLPPLSPSQPGGVPLPGTAYSPTRVRNGAARTFAGRGTLRFGRCEVRVACREVLVDGCVRPLQPRPFDLLVYLIEHRDRVVTIDELLDAIWGDVCVQQGSLPAAIMRVRKALSGDDPAAAEAIRTYSRVGYRFVAPLESHPASS